MKVPSYSNLNEMVRKAPMNAETIAQFRDRALQAVDQAIDTFFQPDREVADGKKAYDELSDVERALRSYQSRFQRESQEAEKNVSAEAAKLKGENFEGPVGATSSMLPDGKPLQDGFRRVSSYSPNVSRLSDLSEETQSMKALIAQMSEVLPLYGSVAMVPGPLAVSLKDHLKQSLQWKTESNSFSSSSAEEEAYRLVTLSAGKKSIQSRSSSSRQEEGRLETTTIDERVMPGLHDIRASLAGLGHSPEEKNQFSLNTKVTEFEKQRVKEGMLWWKSEEDEWNQVNQGYLKQEGQAVGRPARMHLHGTLGNDGLTRPGAGAELVDLVAKSELTPDFVDEYRERSLKVLDGAVSTLFNTQREVKDGREAYDQLVNLQHSLELAQQRFGQSNDYHQRSNLSQPIDVLEEVAPLYACVAMVPGEMSSSVKNYAKELFEIRTSSKSSSFQVGEESSISLLGSLKDASSSSSSQASSKGQLRAETVTTDERIMPALHQLRMQLDQMEMATSRGNHSYLRVPSGKSNYED